MEAPGDDLQALLDRLTEQFGAAGERTVSFLSTARTLLDPSVTAPRVGEAVAYAVREALTAVPGVYASEEPTLAAAYAGVRNARRELEHARGLPGENQDEALLALLRALDVVDDYLARERVHQRRLIDVVVARSRVRPMPGVHDVVEEYQQLLDEVQGKTGLHGSVDVERAHLYYERCLRIFQRLFTSPVERIAALDSLAAIHTPESADVERALQTMVTPHHLDYFMSRISSVAWLRALGFDVLRPPRSGEPWPVLSAIPRLSGEYSAMLTDWLRNLRSTGLDEFQEGYVAFAAQMLAEHGEELMLEVLRSYPESATLSHRGCLMSDERDPSRPFVLGVADIVLNSSCPVDAWTKRHAVVDPLIAGVTRENWSARATVVVVKLARIPSDDTERLRRVVYSDGSIADEDDHPDYAGTFELLRGSLIGILQKAMNAGLTSPDLVGLLDPLPDDLGSLFRTWVLAQPAASSEAGTAELIRSLTLRRPSTDDVLLVSKVRSEIGDESLVRTLRASLPSPPSIDEAASALAEGARVPDEWVRLWAWRPVCPAGALESWNLVLDMISARFGAAAISPHGEAMVSAEYSGRSPISEDELSQVDPLGAATKIASWRPDASDRMVSARYLGRTLEGLVSAEPSRWAEDPVTMVITLREPTYIQHYFAGLAQGTASLAGFGERLIEALLLARKHPWEPHELGDSDFDFDSDWRHADETGIELIGRLAHENVPFGDRKDEPWTMVLAALADRGIGSGVQNVDDPLTAAINRPCTRALGSLLELMGAARRGGGDIPIGAFDALSACLVLGGSEGAQHRAILVRTLGFLQFIAGDWIEENRDLLFGDAAPDELGQQGIDLALKWGRPNRWLLEEYQTSCIEAVRRGVDNALSHTCLGVLLSLDGYAPSDILSSLSGLGTQFISEAGEALARLLRGDAVDESHLVRGLEFWRMALAADVTKEAFFGFGWWTEVSAVPQETWLPLMAETAAKADGNLDWAPKTAERAALPPHSVEGMRILGLLASGVADHWERPIVGKIAVEVVRSSPSDTPVLEQERSRLRDRLLELGVFDALG